MNEYEKGRENRREWEVRDSARGRQGGGGGGEGGREGGREE